MANGNGAKYGVPIGIVVTIVIFLLGLGARDLFSRMGDVEAKCGNFSGYMAKTEQRDKEQDKVIGEVRQDIRLIRQKQTEISVEQQVMKRDIQQILKGIEKLQEYNDQD